MVPTHLHQDGTNNIYAQGFEVSEHDGSKARKVLLVNKALSITSLIKLGGATGTWRCIQSIDGRQPWTAPALAKPDPAGVFLGPFGVAILSEGPCISKRSSS